VTMIGSTLGGAVYDRGYRPYEGSRGGRESARWALWRLTIRRALGLRRSWRQKVLPWTLLGLVTIPAIVNVGVAYASRNTPANDFHFITYREYVGVSAALLLFVAVVAPDAVCPDRHDRVLPLIFSRQLTGTDYVVAKVGAIATIVFGFSVIPQLVLFVGQTFVSDQGALHYYLDHDQVLWQAPVAAALLALYYAVVSVALASLTDRRIVGAIALLGLALVTSSIAGVFVAASHTAGDHQSSIMALVNLLALPLALRDLVFLGHLHESSQLSGVAGGGPLAVLVYAVVTVVSFTLLFWRYSEVDL
jgi:ABC-2 type transport system permease protein